MQIKKIFNIPLNIINVCVFVWSSLPLLVLSVWVYLAIEFFHGFSLLCMVFVGFGVVSWIIRGYLSSRIRYFILFTISVVAILMLLQVCLEGGRLNEWPTVFLLLAWLLTCRAVLGYAERTCIPVTFFLILFGVSLIGLLNTQSQMSAEKSIFLIELMVFCLVVDVYGWRHVVRKKTWLAVLICAAGWLFLCNVLAAQVDGLIANVSRVRDMIGHLLFFWAVYEWARFNERVAENVVGAIAVGTFIIFYAFIWSWFGHSAPRDFDWVLSPPMFNHIRHLGYFLCVSVIVATFWVLSSKSKWFFVSLMMYAVALGLLMWSGSRAGLLSVIVGSCVLLIAYPLAENLGRYLKLVGAGGVALCGSILFYANNPYMGIFSAFIRTSGAISIDGLSSGRLFIWGSLVPSIKERLWFGWGGDGFLSIRDDSITVVQAHNSILQLLVEWGVVFAIGMLLFIFFVMSSGFSKLRKLRSQASPALSLGMAMTSSLLFLSFLDGVFYYGTPSALFFLGLGLVFSQTANEAKLLSPA